MNRLRPTWVEVDLDAIRHNVRLMKPDGAELMAVVKADALRTRRRGRGARRARGRRDVDRRRPRRGGAPACATRASTRRSWSCRSSRRDRRRDALDAGLTPSLYTDGALERLAAAAGGRERRRAREGRYGHAPGGRVSARCDAAVRRAGDRGAGCASRRCGRTSPAPPRTRRPRCSSWNASSPRSKTSAPRGSSRPSLHAANSGATILYPGDPPGPGPNGDRDVRAGARPRASVTLWISVRPSRGAPRSFGRRVCPRGNASRTDTATGWSATRTSPPCRWATPTATLTSCRLGPTS